MKGCNSIVKVIHSQMKKNENLMYPRPDNHHFPHKAAAVQLYQPHTLKLKITSFGFRVEPLLLMDDHAFVVKAITVTHSDILICSTITLNGSAFLLDGREGPTPKNTEPQRNDSHVRSAYVHSAANRIHCSQSVRFLCTWSSSVAEVSMLQCRVVYFLSAQTVAVLLLHGEHYLKQETNY